MIFHPLLISRKIPEGTYLSDEPSLRNPAKFIPMKEKNSKCWELILNSELFRKLENHLRDNSVSTELPTSVSKVFCARIIESFSHSKDCSKTYFGLENVFSSISFPGLIIKKFCERIHKYLAYRTDLRLKARIRFRTWTILMSILSHNTALSNYSE